jgi:hypothetical protein
MNYTETSERSTCPPNHPPEAVHMILGIEVAYSHTRRRAVEGR